MRKVIYRHTNWEMKLILLVLQKAKVKDVKNSELKEMMFVFIQIPMDSNESIQNWEM